MQGLINKGGNHSNSRKSCDAIAGSMHHLFRRYDARNALISFILQDTSMVYASNSSIEKPFPCPWAPPSSSMLATPGGLFARSRDISGYWNWAIIAVMRFWPEEVELSLSGHLWWRWARWFLWRYQRGGDWDQQVQNCGQVYITSIVNSTDKVVI